MAEVSHAAVNAAATTAAAAPGLGSEQLGPTVRPPLLAGPARAGAGGRGAGQGRTGFPVEDVHLVLIQTFGAAELEPLLSRAKVQVLLGVADVLAPIAHLRRGGERLWRLGSRGENKEVTMTTFHLFEF